MPIDQPIFFESQADLRSWLKQNHASEPYLWVGMYRKAAGRPCLTHAQVVDEVLCFGWIDGVLRKIDSDSFMQRISPRRNGSVWSAINIKRAQELIELGLMEPAGLAAFERRHEARQRQYSYENAPRDLPPEYAAIFQQDEAAWRFFSEQPPGYRRGAVWWVLSAAREETRRKRLETLVARSAAGQRLDPLRPNAPLQG